MSDITLAENYFHDYKGTYGKEWYDFDKRVIQHICSVGNRDFGYMRFEVDEVGDYCYKRVRVFYENALVYCAQETSSGDWWLSLCRLKSDSPVWQYILKA